MSRLRELAGQATPGPWRHVGGIVAGHAVDAVYGGEDGETQITRWPMEDDARLIALATDLAVLLADAKDALAAVRDWVREGKGTEADAAEAMDSVLARIEELEGRA